MARRRASADDSDQLALWDVEEEPTEEVGVPPTTSTASTAVERIGATDPLVATSVGEGRTLEVVTVIAISRGSVSAGIRPQPRPRRGFSTGSGAAGASDRRHLFNWMAGPSPLSGLSRKDHR